LAVYFLLSGMRASAQATIPPTPTDTAVTPATPEKNSEKLDEAKRAFVARDIDRATKLLEESLKDHPDMPSAQIILAQWFYQFTQMPNMRAAVENAIKNDPTDPDPYVLLGRIAQDERRCTEADVLYSRASELLKTYKNTKRKPTLDGQTINGLAWVAEQRQHWKDAKDYLEQLLTTLKNTPTGSDEKSRPPKRTPWRRPCCG
jgi:tetratricopeptide (TPR) repeat protein